MIYCHIQRLHRIFAAILLLAIAVFAMPAAAVNFTPLPPYLTETKGSPMVMLNLSRDHQLFYKAYNEFSDLDGDGVVETQYKHSYNYYGYFDNQRCYLYSTANNRYESARKVGTDRYCGQAGEWSGNFLNWATMTRMDVVRRILYGGYRSTDGNATTGTTVLERAHLPTDAHAFAKYYAGSDIAKLTPFNEAEITICNATFRNGTNQYSHNAPGLPLMQVARGNYSLWNANERWQCYWSGPAKTDTLNNAKDGIANGNQAAVTGINAQGGNPSRNNQGLGTGIEKGTYVVRVEVCNPGTGGAASLTTDESSRCKLYPSGKYKPIGLLQKYGERNEAAFGLLTGSFDKNISGGVLRKNISTFSNEVDPLTGQFVTSATGNGIVKNLNAMRIYGYDYSDGTYTGLDQCNFETIGLTEGKCTSWGNPIGEMYLESLRYLAGKTTPTTAFATPDAKGLALGMTVETWIDPFNDTTVATFGERTCRRSSIINFNASVTSYDSDQWTNDIAGMDVTALTDRIGSAEGLYATGTKWTIGRTATDTNNFCSDKTLTALSGAAGICPEAPTGYGGFKIAGAALYAHTNRIRTDIAAPANNTRAFRVNTYGVALATSTPRISIPVPGAAGKFVVIQPAMRLFKETGGGGALVDFRVVNQTATSGKFVVQWEDSEQGGDYDQDLWGTLEYTVDTANKRISVTTFAASQSTGGAIGFGYAITGTAGKDGVHIHSGINNATFTDPVSIGGIVTPATKVNASGGCNACTVGDPKTTAVYTMSGVSGAQLRDPLWYAAKYGGFDTAQVPSYSPGAVLPAAAWDSKKTDGSLGADGVPDNFFYAVDPGELEQSLNDIFAAVLTAGGAAPTASAASRTQAGGYIYASTNSIKPKAVGSAVDADGSGQLLRYSFNTDGSLKGNEDWRAGDFLNADSAGTGWRDTRKILSLSDTAPIAFAWDSLSNRQKNALMQNPANPSIDTAAIGANRLAWLRGDNSNETVTGINALRIRPGSKLGAIISSTPWYISAPAAGYTNAQYGGGYGAFRTGIKAANGGTDRATLFVGANDGMLHAFDGNTGHELFAYVPRAMYTTAGAPPYSKLSAISAKDFNLGDSANKLTVDGSVMTADVKVGGTWSTYLFGAFGRGARGIYALNVTKPNTVSEASPADVVKWEFTEAADTDMGYITGRTNTRSNGQPFQTGYMANGKWAAIYGNGYNSTSGRAALFIVFADGPTSPSSTTWTPNTQYVKILTPLVAGDGADNGMASPTAVDTNNDGVIDRIYAGDLKGNVWKFDVSNPNPAEWKIANTLNGTAVPLFKATTVVASGTTSTTVPQPITTPIVPFAHPLGGYQLFFATGKALESNDYPMSVVRTNTMYGIYDKPGTTSTLTTGKTHLVQQTVTFADGYRFITNNAVDYNGADLGWYADLPVSSEGVVFNPFFEDSARVNVRSLAPAATSDGCRFDGTSFDMTLNPITGTAIVGAFPNSTVVTNGAIGVSNLNYFEGTGGGKLPVPASQVPADPGNGGTDPSATPLMCQGQCVFRTNIAGGDGKPKILQTCGACNSGRLTWREIFRNR
ncbi:type IV pilus assembly protein PilY1 [Variovorax boronicumulans]|uniref:pilus assembly protein n=1 Tax=Variovorax boronicumulans TaxID=436515 RepID=UPI002474D6AC|nr:PilC/PilY family type IV pilus protein [Variovorax boronicumulans]MDH6167263.1 type IV pilus assembly protein PilY1 [Variovorax boronicumulans]